MAKVIKTIAADNNMEFGDICSFKTENYIGIWNAVKNKYYLLLQSNGYFACFTVPECDSLEKLDSEVFSICQEHIEEVFADSNYTFNLKAEH